MRSSRPFFLSKSSTVLLKGENVPSFLTKTALALWCFANLTSFEVNLHFFNSLTFKPAFSDASPKWKRQKKASTTMNKVMLQSVRQKYLSKSREDMWIDARNTNQKLNTARDSRGTWLWWRIADLHEASTPQCDAVYSLNSSASQDHCYNSDPLKAIQLSLLLQHKTVRKTFRLRLDMNDHLWQCLNIDERRIIPASFANLLACYLLSYWSLQCVWRFVFSLTYSGVVKGQLLSCHCFPPWSSFR